MNTLLIGCGLMGGSLVLDLRKLGLVSHVTGADLSEENLKLAAQMGFIDDQADWQLAIKDVDLVILAIPVDASVKIISELLTSSRDDTIIMDLGSTKGAICAKVAKHSGRGKYVATHPIAGTENSGPKAAFSGLFDAKMALICDPEKSSDNALETVVEIYKAIGSRVIEMSASEHDKHVAYVSHLSHISSFTLGLTVLDIEKSENNIHLLAGSGFDSTVRLAKSSPEMWEPIFTQNVKDVTSALDEYIDHLKNFRDLILNNDKDELIKQMRRANEIRRILDQ